MSHEIRAARPDERDALHTALGRGFFFDPSPESHELFGVTAEMDRSRCVFEGDQIIGTLGAYSFSLSVPGGQVPAAGTTWVTVRASHRRQGVLRALMASHIEDIRAHNEPLAALWASESGIYGRFGFGLATYTVGCKIYSNHAAFRTPLEAPGRVRLVDPDEASTLLPRVYAPCASERPGHFARTARWWERRLADPLWEREGHTAFRFAIYEDRGEPRGYLQYRVRERWGDDGVPASSLRVVELQGLDSTARAALWRFAFDIDLVREVQCWNRPVDDELPWLLRDPRRLTRLVRDGLWVRVVDVEQALAARRYGTEARLVLGIRDALCPWNEGAWELEAGPDGAQCKPTNAEPQLTLDAEDLGAIYLGGNRPTALARAGRIAGNPQALRRADHVFASDVAPWSPEIF